MALPSKLASYLISGRPVLAAVSATSETARELRSSQGGLVVPPENPEALADSIVRLRGDPFLAAQLGLSGRRYALLNLSERMALEQYDAFIAAISSSEPMHSSAFATDR